MARSLFSLSRVDVGQCIQNAIGIGVTALLVIGFVCLNGKSPPLSEPFQHHQNTPAEAAQLCNELYNADGADGKTTETEDMGDGTSATVQYYPCSGNKGRIPLYQ